MSLPTTSIAPFPTGSYVQGWLLSTRKHHLAARGNGTFSFYQKLANLLDTCWLGTRVVSYSSTVLRLTAAELPDWPADCPMSNTTSLRMHTHTRMLLMLSANSQVAATIRPWRYTVGVRPMQWNQEVPTGAMR